ncbi:uncharacterized protein BHQ10_002025 [Talaromyces amestolkiae]|uniref:Uncharacterized protein n=1 Tax=Talaromyces amestolkiae TaxID=1196081 RepID=A0A364KR47_TALAM|nr:uncharacterized protein BHQ10_002025 [Talaromyces amestolkiae]RAO66013.1 hypothetical protein BHQ10_002025 [Talaromyces amestolkiae]
MEGINMLISEVEPIAIVGLSCRLPGGADTPEKLWDLVHEGRQCWQDVPSDRYNWKAFHHPDPDTKGTHNSRGGFFLDQNLAEFDAGFFGIPAAEAAAMDPQQRILLEVSYEAFENTGMSLESLRGSRTGVYVALVSRDYERQTYKDPYQIPKHHLTGCGDATACGRISYVFDLKGPCMSLDTGCSGGMVALHLACQALRLGESDAAIVGGTNLLLGPDMTIAMSALRMINDEGRCYPFDSRGAGYGRAEGVAALVLKRLKDAVKDGDNVRAIIRNSGVNQDGKTNGILLPSSEAQGQLTAALYRQVGIHPREVSYVEAHGTGTQAGDAAEFNSIKQVFVDMETQRDHPLFLGSIKANLGHSESTSGLAGVIKTVMALEKSVIPPVSGLEIVKPSLYKMLESGDIILPKEPHQWPHSGRRLASVNSFGFGGTNAHVILESAPALSHNMNYANGWDEKNGNGSYTRMRFSDVSENLISPADGLVNTHDDSHDRNKARVENISSPSLDKVEPQLFVISAKSRTSLEGAVRNLKNWVSNHCATDGTVLNQLAKTLSSRRSQFKWRSSVIASSHLGLLSGLENVRTTKCSPKNQVVFLFTGQGAQYPGMGRELLVLHTSFAQSLYRSQDILKSLGASWSLVDEILCEESKSRINSSELSQPATTAIQIALVDMILETNVRPAMVLGHSSGEVAAAYAAGILNHKDALTISYYKGFVSGWCKETLPSKGAMLAVGLGEKEIMRYLQSCHSGRCVIGCVNSPSSLTLSGDELAIMEIQEMLDKDSVFNRRLKVDIAYHSHHMKAISDRFLQCLDGLMVKPPQNSVRFFSSVTGSEEFLPLSAKYWVDNLISQVRFAPALETLTRMHFESSSESLVLLEIGPHAALQGPIRQILTSAGPRSSKWLYSPTLVRNKDAHVAALEMVASLFESGIKINIPANFSRPENYCLQLRLPVLLNLPPYSWDHSNQYWHEGRLSKEYRFRQHAPHDLLGLRLTGTSTIEPIFRHILNVDDFPWLKEHIIDGFALYPGSAFLCMAIEAMRQVSKDRGEKSEISKYIFQEVSFSKALVIPDSPASIEVLLSFKPSQSSSERLDITWEEFRVTSVTANGKWNEHCRGLIRADYRSNLLRDVVGGAVGLDFKPSLARERLQAMSQDCSESVTTEAIYDEMRRNGIDYGDAFAIIQDLQLGDHQAFGKVKVPEIGALTPSQYMQPHIIHPAVFDAFMHIALPLYHRHCSQGPVMLVSIAEVSISADILNKPGDDLLVACRLTEAGRRQGSVEVSILQEDLQGNLKEVGHLLQENFCAIGEGESAENAPSSRSSSAGFPPPCYHLEWVPASWVPKVHQKDHVMTMKRVSVFCFSDNAIAESLAKRVSSRLGVRWDGRSCAVVPQTPDSMDPENIHIIFIDENSSMSTLKELFVALSNLKSVLWVNIATPKSPSVGRYVYALARSVQQEVEGYNGVVLDYHLDASLEEELQLSDVVLQVLLRCFVDAIDPENPIDREYVYWKGDLLVSRLVLHNSSNEWLDAKVNGKNVEKIAAFHADDNGIKLDFKTPGLLDSGLFVPIENSASDLDADEVLVRIYAHAVNQTDVLIALGRGQSSDLMVGEFSGEILAVGSLSWDIYKPGDRVCGWGALPYANIARVQCHRVHRVGGSISFVEAASIPLAFQTAAHALMNIAQLGPSQKILIHGAAGAIGQAAVSIAQYLGAEVYATVGSSEKQQLLMEDKNIPGARIFSSMSNTFSDAILSQTAGRGVDVVLNCSSGDLNMESISCIADFGYLIDITKSRKPLIFNSRARKNITVSSVDMELLAKRRPTQVQQMFAKVMALYEGGRLTPITPITTKSITDFANAFRHVQGQHHYGKTVLKCDKEVSVKQMARKSSPLRLSADGVYIVLGGDETLNHSLCMFLKDHGAISIVSVMFFGNAIQADSNDWSAFERIRLDIGNETGVPIVLSSRLGLDRVSVMGVLFVEEIFKASKSFIPIILEYCIRRDARQDSSSDLFVGLKKITRHVKNPVFSALNDKNADGESRDTKLSPTSISQRLADIETLDDLHTMVMAALVEQLASLLALDPDDIQVRGAAIDIGLDSILAIEFKKWVVRTIQAPIQTSEILDAPTLTQLTQLIVQRSKLCQSLLLPRSRSEDFGRHYEATATPSPNGHPLLIPVSCSTDTNENEKGLTTDLLPALPIPDLKVIIERHLSYMRAFATDEEFRNTLEIAAEFQATGSIGKRLYDRLQAIKRADPDNWYHDLYLRNQYLARKGGLAPYMSFFFTHPTAPMPGSQAARAAIVVSAVIEHKYQLDRKQVKTRYMNEQPLCMDLSRYLFNACREPKAGLDVMHQYSRNDYFIVLRRGHVFKIDFQELDNFTQRERLESIFETILDASLGNVDWLGLLTADDRRSWAKNREAFVNFSEANAAYIRTIEESAFLVCLDDGSPETAEERGRHFHFGDGSNRWNDKPIEYVITANGVSGIVGDHTGLDAGTILDLNQKISEQIRCYQSPEPSQRSFARIPVILKKITYTEVPSNIAANIEKVRSDYQKAIALREHRYPPSLPYGALFMKTHKIPANSGAQLLIQLAARYYFGYINPCWETVLQSNFQKGRVELNQVVTTQVAAFINAAADDSITLSTCKRLFIEAARTHSSAVLSCTRGNGSDRLLSILKEILEEGEEVPRLFQDPVYQRSRPRKFCSNCFTSGMAEDGCCLRDETGIWVHHEVQPEQVKFSIVGPTGKTSEFYKSLVKAGERVKEILNA